MTRAALAVTLLLAVATGLSAQELKLTGSIRLRGESFDWFATPGYDDQYAFLGSLIRLSAARQHGSFDWNVEVAQPSLFGLPENAIAPAPQGQLGLGASYYASNRDGNAAGIFIKQAAIRFKRGNDAFRLGRFEFSEGAETTPKDATVAMLKSSRVAQRLIGPFGYSLVGRAFDGFHYSHQAPTWNATALLVRPTSGAFEINGGYTLDVDLAYGSYTTAIKGADARLFAAAYRDRRNVLKTDNRPAAARQSDTGDVEVTTVGGHYIRMMGNVDVVLWGAWQEGNWGALDHRANAFDLETGYHFQSPMKPRLRAGIFRSSGDSSAADREHGTFFQMLTTPRIYARFPFYNAMNSTDAFLQFGIKPSPKLTVTSELHRLRLTSSSDLWYAGGGAFDDRSFGFAGRPSGGREDLATTVDVSLDYALNPKTTLTFYAATALGGDVVSRIYPAGDDARYVYLELLRRF